MVLNIRFKFLYDALFESSMDKAPAKDQINFFNGITFLQIVSAFSPSFMYIPHFLSDCTGILLGIWKKNAVFFQVKVRKPGLL